MTGLGIFRTMNPSFSHDPAEGLYIVTADGHQGTVLYRPAGAGIVDFQSTYIPFALRHRNLGTALVRYALEQARSQGVKVIPSCWFVGQVVDRMPEYREVLVDSSP